MAVLDGNVGRVWAGVDDCGRLASRVEQVGLGVRGLPGVAPSWRGAAADAFVEWVDASSKRLLVVGEALGEAQGLLREYAYGLEALQRKVVGLRGELVQARAVGDVVRVGQVEEDIERAEDELSLLGDVIAQRFDVLLADPVAPDVSGGVGSAGVGGVDVGELFVSAVSAEFGFSQETTWLMWKVWQGIEVQYADRPLVFRAWLFARVMGGISYGGWQWDQTAGDLSGFGDGGIREVLMELGLSQDEADGLIFDVIVQHDIVGNDNPPGNIRVDGVNEILERHHSTRASIEGVVGSLSDEEFVQRWDASAEGMYQKSGLRRGDFSHLMVTMAANLGVPSVFAAGVYFRQAPGVTLQDSPVEFVREAAGWRGDTTSVADAPNMGPDDYVADLDAVNLARRVEAGQELPQAFAQYYRLLGAGEVNRAEEFLVNLEYTGDVDRASDGYEYVKGEILADLGPGECEDLMGTQEGQTVLAMRYLFGGSECVPRPALERLAEENPSGYRFLQALANRQNHLDQ